MPEARKISKTLLVQHTVAVESRSTDLATLLVVVDIGLPKYVYRTIRGGDRVQKLRREIPYYS
jgi:hypothetical protein